MRIGYKPKVSVAIVRIDTGLIELHTVVSLKLIVVYLDDGSSAECSDDSGGWRGVLEKEFNMVLDPKYPLFYFNRIKVKTESEGRGTVLMKALTGELDNQQVAVIATTHSYGRMSNCDLEKWYGEYGFQSVTKGLLLRIPSGKVMLTDDCG